MTSSTIHHEILDMPPVLEASLDGGSSSNDDDLCRPKVHGCSIPYMLLVALPRLPIMMGWAAQWAVLGPLLEILVSSSVVQLIQIAGPLCGLLVVPTLGVLSDNCLHPYGRRRPFLFWGAVTSILAYVLLMFAADIGAYFGDTATSRPTMTGIVIVCYIWTDITLNIAMVPVTLLMADVVGDRQVTGSVVTGVLSSGGLLVTAVYIAAFGPAHQSLKTFLSILIGLLGVTCGATCWFVVEKPYVYIWRSNTGHRVKIAVTAVIAGIRQLPSPLGVYFVLILLSTYGFTSYNGAKGQFFGLVVNGGDPNGADLCRPSCSPRQAAFNDGVRVAGLTDTLQVLAFLYVLLLPTLVHRFGAKRVVTMSLLPQGLYVVMAYSKHTAVNVAIAVSCSITQATMNLLIVPLIIHVVGHGPDNSLGLINGALNSALCTGQLLNYVLAAALVTSPMGYALPILVGGLLSLVAAVVALLCFRVSMYSL
ncbi:hypothetical protein DYB26_009794 [Aphanomyces astaci]|uniref:Major facilitator superfamily (MFS) profile domain-containing protein n=1 Tax=Aphanomyces astaci TaxID=112090 RepID=A0A397EHM6_APHAT|nr:hypothetical protein DYB38_008040 [Aphanomyces astaci]RHY79142.1 hypothetical protein DYB31_015595 [Aphanomyces astaci]RHZ08162.1 hypothetical protein DYB26_009794 [Aphanomyces astaci]